MKPNPITADFDPYFTVLFGIGWSPAQPSPPAPGFGWLISPFASFSLCVQTNLPAPALPLDLPPGFSLVSCQYFQVATFEDIVGRFPDPGTQVHRLKPGSPWFLPLGGTNYSIYTFANGTWMPSVPTADIGEAVWVLQPPKISNPQFVSGSFQFETRTATFATLDVEYTDALDGTSPYLLTNVVGSGNVTNVVDTSPANSAEQRFYRLKLKPMP